MTSPVFQDRLPYAPWLNPATWRLPGVQPLATEDWLIQDDAFESQMRLRDQLIAERPDAVHALTPQATEAALECLELCLDALNDDQGYQCSGQTVIRPDGVQVAIDRDKPLMTMGRLVQADICLMHPGPGGHTLTGAILCFPSHWTLSEKLGKPMIAIHRPVARYDDDIATRVQRLFDAMRPEQLLWRANAFLHHSPDLYTPLRESDPRTDVSGRDAPYLRSERQTLRKLAGTGAVVFTIHTFIVPVSKLTEEQRAGIATSGMGLG